MTDLSQKGTAVPPSEAIAGTGAVPWLSRLLSPRHSGAEGRMGRKVLPVFLSVLVLMTFSGCTGKRESLPGSSAAPIQSVSQITDQALEQLTNDLGSLGQTVKDLDAPTGDGLIIPEP